MADQDNRKLIENGLEVLKEARRDAVSEIAAGGYTPETAATMYSNLTQIQAAITAFEAVLSEMGFAHSLHRADTVTLT